MSLDVHINIHFIRQSKTDSLNGGMEKLKMDVHLHGESRVTGM